MTVIWNKIDHLSKKIEEKFNSTGFEIQEKYLTNYSWYNKLWDSPRYRRAHIQIIDKRSDYGIYILHATVFPHYNDPSPIWGFDAVCGKNKITGAFHDFSNSGAPDHDMMKWFSNKVNQLSWSKHRDLPEWARQIFSHSMIAAGNIQDENEIDNLSNLALETLDYYLDNVGLTQTCGADFHMAQNRYCHYQKQNPQVINSMVAMGVPESTILKFVDEVLFPEAA